MTNIDFMIDGFTDVWKLVLRLLLAGVCGYIIGRERKARSKEAGVRTHAIVCLASALMMILSKYAFIDTVGGDAGRIAAQIVTGIGFLGAGMIFYRRDMLQGLTTAAGVWATAGIGMAIGAGMIVVGICSVAFILIIQICLHLRVGHKNKYRQAMAMKATLSMEEPENIENFKKLFGINKFIKYRTYTFDKQNLVDIEFITREDFTLENVYEITRKNSYILSLETAEE